MKRSGIELGLALEIGVKPRMLPLRMLDCFFYLRGNLLSDQHL